jgi:hypothetical protein
MQSVITAQLTKNRELLSKLIQEDRIDEPTAAKHMMDSERLAASGVVLELRYEPTPQL